MNQSEKISIIAACLSYATYEANVYWQRNAIYLTLNSIMAGIVAATFSSISPVLIILIGMFGLFFNWHWRHVNEYSKALAERWRQDARNLAESDSEISVAMTALMKTSSIRTPAGPIPSVVMNRLAEAFPMLWFGITIGGILLGAWQLIAGSIQLHGG